MDEMEKLAYQNRFVRQLVQTLEDYSEADCEGNTPQVVSGADNIIILRVSLEEWTRLLSSVFTGADICYPSESDSVRWSLLRAVECPVDLCALIANCIATSEATQNAIRDFVLGDEALTQQISDLASQQALSILERERNLLKPEACDYGFVFNQTSVMVQLLHDLTEDLFEAIEVGTNALERASIITSGIPIFGQIIPADELLQLADQLVEEVADDYMGAYDEALYDSIRCDLFCLVKDDCELSIDRAIVYYEAKVGEAFPDDPWEALKAIIGYLNVGDFGTDTPVYAMHLLVLALIRQMQTVLGVDFGILGLRITAAGDESDNDYEILCEECIEPPPPDPDCVDLTETQEQWGALNAIGIYYPGEGLGPKLVSGNYYWTWQRVQDAVSRTIYEMEFTFNQVPPPMRIYSSNGASIVITATTTTILINETTAPALVPLVTAGAGQIAVHGAGTNGLVPGGAALRMSEFCLRP